MLDHSYSSYQSFVIRTVVPPGQIKHERSGNGGNKQNTVNRPPGHAGSLIKGLEGRKETKDGKTGQSPKDEA